MITPNKARKWKLAVACGGTGGHFFPGLAVAQSLEALGGEVFLMISPKQVDQEAVKQAQGLECIALPATGFQSGSRVKFFPALARSYRQSLALFRTRNVDAVLGMGGFTSAGPVLAAPRLGN